MGIALSSLAILFKSEIKSLSAFFTISFFFPNFSKNKKHFSKSSISFCVINSSSFSKDNSWYFLQSSIFISNKKLIASG